MRSPFGCALLTALFLVVPVAAASHDAYEPFFEITLRSGESPGISTFVLDRSFEPHGVRWGCFGVVGVFTLLGPSGSGAFVECEFVGGGGINGMIFEAGEYEVRHSLVVVGERPFFYGLYGIPV